MKHPNIYIYFLVFIKVWKRRMFKLLLFQFMQKKEILAAVRKISSLNVFIMDEIDSNARLDGGDVLFTGW